MYDINLCGLWSILSIEYQQTGIEQLSAKSTNIDVFPYPAGADTNTRRFSITSLSRPVSLGRDNKSDRRRGTVTRESIIV